MIDGEYNVRIVAADGLWDKSRVELHAVGDVGGSDFLGIDPSVQDIAMVEGGRPVMASHVAMAERAIMLADSTRTYHNTLVREAEELLQGPEGELLVDEQEIAELLDLRKLSWNVLSQNTDANAEAMK